jgi:hypothetical protein
MDESIHLWIGFKLATEWVERVRGVSRGAAQKAIDDAIAAGVLRTNGNDVADVDLQAWLAERPSAGGKQGRITAQLAKRFPDGVPDRAAVPRQPLQADLIAADPSLDPLDLKTLATAIKAHNAATRKR